MEKIKWRTRFDRLPFLARILWDMPRALDMVDSKGEPDHAKMLPYSLLVAVVALKCVGITFLWYELMILAALTGGISTVRLLIKSGIMKGQVNRTEALTETVLKQEQRTITERRNYDLGIEPTPD